MKPALFLSVSLVLISIARPAPGQPAEPADSLIGTWILTALARADSDDEPVRARGQRGVLILDGAGNVFEFFSTAERNEPEVVSGDPQRTLEKFGGFWGTYAVTDNGAQIAFSAKDGVSPAVHSLDFRRDFALDGDQLVLVSGDEPQAQGNTRWTWQRMPNVENLSPAYRQVVGFWQHVEERQVNRSTGEVQRSSQRAPSVIVYTPSGFVGVHFPPVGREAFTSDSPDADEAQAALRGYIGYFGTLGVYPGEVSHNILSGISPGTGSILRRAAAISGDELVVTLYSGAPRTTGEGPATVTEVQLHRLSDAADMLPR
jgi:hypothetical protein